MNRRGFLNSILIAAVAPAIVRADSLMRIVPLETTVINPLFIGFDLAAIKGEGTAIAYSENGVIRNVKVWPGVEARFALGYKDSLEEFKRMYPIMGGIG